MQTCHSNVHFWLKFRKQHTKRGRGPLKGAVSDHKDLQGSWTNSDVGRKKKTEQHSSIRQRVHWFAPQANQCFLNKKLTASELTCCLKMPWMSPAFWPTPGRESPGPRPGDARWQWGSFRKTWPSFRWPRSRKGRLARPKRGYRQGHGKMDKS